MVHKMSKKLLSILLVLTMAISVLSMTAVTTSAATIIPIHVLDVNRRYRDVQYFLNLLNKNREEKGLSTLKLDSSMTEKAMKRAVEQVFAPSVGYRPDGSSSLSDGDYIIDRNVSTYSSWFNSLVADRERYNMLYSKNYSSIGIGYVAVERVYYGCILLSSNSSKSSPDSSLLDKYNYKVTQDIDVRSDYLKGSQSKYLNGQRVLCGISLDPAFKYVNPYQDNMTAYYTSDKIEVATTSKSVFSYENGKIKALYPGTSIITMSIPNVSEVYSRQTFEAFGNNMAACKVSGIEDQFYTGEYLRPGVTVTNSAGKMLEIGNDYRLEYQNNKEIGTATVKIIGMNSYAGSQTKQTFNIIKSPYGAFRVTAYSDKRKLYTGESTTVTTKITDKQTAVNYTFEYAPYDTNQWKTLQASSTNSSCKFTLNVSGKFNVRVTAIDTKGRRSSTMLSFEIEPRMVLNVSQHVSTLKLGETYSVLCNATGGTNPLRYTCSVTSGSYKKAVANSGGYEKGQFSFVPPTAGTYRVTLTVTSATGRTDTKYVSFTVTGQNLTNTSTVSSTSISQGNSVTVKASGKGGVGSYQYAVFYKQKAQTKWTTVQTYKSNSTIRIVPKAATQYDICVKIKDNAGTIAKQYFTVTVKKAPLKNTSYVSATTIKLGTSVTAKCSATGGAGSYQYAVFYKKSSSSKWTTVQTYKSNSVVNVKPLHLGSYDICIKVKDKSGTVSKVYDTVTVAKTAPIIIEIS